MTTYRIRGYTGRFADFDFRLHNTPVAPRGNNLRDAILSAIHNTHLDLWNENLDTEDIDFEYELGEGEERADLRETDSQRVWVVTSIYCNLDQDITNITHRCGDDGDGQGDDTDCENDDFMITVDVEEG